ncbi:bifunctional oligoribonuclease/PAP phosphatase NrnA [candidate division KSB1 bacterium]
MASHDWKKLKDIFENNQTFTITTHVNPDGDGIGSEQALYYFLKQMGKEVKIYNSNEPPAAFRYLINDLSIFDTYEPGNDDWILESDVIIVLDISTLERLVRMAPAVRKSKALKVCIDHHEGNEIFGDLSIIDESACATAELIYEMINNLGGKLDYDIALGLYVGILTDTGSFRYSQSVDRAHIIASDLLKYGIDPEDTYKYLYENSSWNRFELFKLLLDRTKKEYGGKLVWSKITTEMFENSSAKREEIEGFVDFPMTIQGVEVSILFLEVPNRGTKISLRSIKTIDVQKLAAQFGGGGHKHASGIRLFDTGIDDAEKMVIEEAVKIFE